MVLPSRGFCVPRSADGGIGHAAGSGGRHEGVGRTGGVQEQAAGERGPQGVVLFQAVCLVFMC